MDLDRAKDGLQDGYCLWVGAGVTKQLWPGAPQWGELTKKLEALAELADDCSLQYPQRLGRCSEKLGSDLFRRHLRKIYYTDLCEALLKRVAQALEDGDGIPPESRKVAALGQLANPIVSFNIEHFLRLSWRDLRDLPALFHSLSRKLRGSNSESLLTPFKESCTILMAYRPSTA
jgi:hypothetical protein